MCIINQLIISFFLFNFLEKRMTLIIVVSGARDGAILHSDVRIANHEGHNLVNDWSNCSSGEKFKTEGDKIVLLKIGSIWFQN